MTAPSWACLVLLASPALDSARAERDGTARAERGATARAERSPVPAGKSAPDGGTLTGLALSRPVDVSADKLEILGKQNRAIYSGRAKAVRDTTTITCDKLVVHYSSKQEVTRIEAFGQVRVLDDDRRAQGDQADFDNASGVLTLTGSPEAHQGGSHVSGSKVVFTTGSDVIDVDDARTVVEGASAPGTPAPVRIDARALRIFGQANQAVWTGQVKAHRGTLDVTSARAVASYGPDHQLTHLLAQGDVEAAEADRWARGERADFDPKTEQLVVTGHPEAKQGKNHLRGSKVVFTQGKDKLEVENPVTHYHPEPKK